MQIREIMTEDVVIADPSQTIQDAARLMAKIDAGLLPVGDKDRLIGMISDRDIAIRAVGEGKSSDTKISDVMSKEVKYCFDSDDVSEVCANMAERQVRRLPVVDKDKRLVGIVALADLTAASGAGQALAGISKPGGKHNQSSDGAVARA